MGTLRLGLIPRGEERDPRERAFVDALAAALDDDVEVHRAQDYRVIVSGLEHALVDFAWLPPLPAARAVRTRLAEPVAIVVRYGATSYMTGLVTRADSPIRSTDDLRDARVAWVDRDSAGGYLVLRAALARAGVRLAFAFGREVFVRSHGAVARAVLDGQVDVGATCVHTDPDGTVHVARSPFAGDLGLPTEQLRVVFEAGPIPADIFAVRRGAAPRIRAAVEGALLHGRPRQLHAAACTLLYADGFAVPTADHRRMLEALLDDVASRRNSTIPPRP
jgi:phosphonate transport system substrate-binding protein